MREKAYFWTAGPHVCDAYELRRGYKEEIQSSGGDIVTVMYDKRPTGWAVSEFSTGLGVSRDHKTLAAAADSARKDADKMVEALKSQHCIQSEERLYQWCKGHDKDIMEAMAADKASRKKKRQEKNRQTPRPILAAVNSVIKTSVKSGCIPSYEGVFLADGHYCVCDGYRLMRFNQDILEAAHVETNDYNFIIAKIIDDQKIIKNGEVLHIPPADEIKAFIKRERADRKAAKEAGVLMPAKTPMCIDGFIYVDAEYLLDMVKAFPGVVAYKPSRPINPIYFVANNGDGILMPIRPPKSKEEQEKEQAEREAKASENERRYREAEAQKAAEINGEAEKRISEVIDVMINGGQAYTPKVTIYTGDGATHEKHILWLIAERYSINLPIKLKGWIRKAVYAIRVNDFGRLDNYSRFPNSSKSTTIYDYMDKLILAVRADHDAHLSAETATDIPEDDELVRKFFGVPTDDEKETAQESEKTISGGHVKNGNGGTGMQQNENRCCDDTGCSSTGGQVANSKPLDSS